MDANNINLIIKEKKNDLSEYKDVEKELDNKIAGSYTKPSIGELSIYDKVEVMSKSSWHFCTVVKTIEDTHIVVRRSSDGKEATVPLSKTRLFKRLLY